MKAGAAGCFPLASSLAGAATAPERQLPHEQDEEPGHRRQRDDLSDRLRSAGHAATMKTGVPMSTWVNSHSTCGINIRMQPWEAE